MNLGFRKCRKAIAAVTAATIFAPAWAAGESLQQAWQQAMQHDYALAAATANADSAHASERAAQAARWPSLNATGAYTRFATAPSFQFAAPGFALQAPIFADNEFASAGVQMQLPIYTGGRITAAIDAAHQAVIGASAAESIARSALRLDVAESYVAVIRTKRLLQTAESSVASLRAHADDVGSMVERALVARNDLLAARVALANAEQQRVRAENGVALAYAAYNRRLGEPLDRAPELDATIAVDRELAAQSLAALLERAADSRSELQALTAQADALALNAKAERAQLLPQFALTGGYNYLQNEILDRRDFSMIGVGFNWHLFDAGQARHRSDALQSASRAARRQFDDLHTQIELQVREAWLNVREARTRVTTSGEAAAQAEENLRIARELYGTGLGTNTQVLEAIALKVSAENNRDNAVLDESLAQLRLAHAVGSL